MTEPRKPRTGPATSAMRLKPAAGPGPAPTPEPPPELAELVAALDRLHSPLELADRPLCRECLTDHPCRTVRLVHPGAGGPPTPEEGSQ